LIRRLATSSNDWRVLLCREAHLLGAEPDGVGHVSEALILRFRLAV
jgi:hypothetical protein